MSRIHQATIDRSTEKSGDEITIDSVHSANAIIMAVERALRRAIMEVWKECRRIGILDEIAALAEDHGIIMLEDSIIKRMPQVKPLGILKGRNIVGVDGGVFSLKLYPFRIIVARSGVYSFPMRDYAGFGVRNIWRFILSVLRSRGRIEEQLRKKMREVLFYVESTTVREIAEEYGSAIDVVFWDGPMYTRRHLRKQYSTIKSLSDRAIMCIRVVKNPFSSRLLKGTKMDSLTDADVLSYYLRPNMRTSMFLLDNRFVRGIPRDLKPVFFYVKTDLRVLLRYEFPYWMLEEYGIDDILNIIAADLAMGNGFSYVVGRADFIARFSEDERRYIAFKIFRMLRENGFPDFLTFNQRRWGKFLNVWSQ